MAACMSVVAVVVTLMAAGVYQLAAGADARRQLSHECQALASILNQTDNDVALLSGAELGDFRVTLIAHNGTVLYDSAEDARGMARIIRSVGLDRVQLLPFHNFGESKYDLLDLDYRLHGAKNLREEDLADFAKVYAEEGVRAFF